MLFLPCLLKGCLTVIAFGWQRLWMVNWAVIGVVSRLIFALQTSLWAAGFVEVCFLFDSCQFPCWEDTSNLHRCHIFSSLNLYVSCLIVNKQTAPVALQFKQCDGFRILEHLFEGLLYISFWCYKSLTHRVEDGHRLPFGLLVANQHDDVKLILGHPTTPM